MNSHGCGYPAIPLRIGRHGAATGSRLPRAQKFPFGDQCVQRSIRNYSPEAVVLDLKFLQSSRFAWSPFKPPYRYRHLRISPSCSDSEVLRPCAVVLTWSGVRVEMRMGSTLPTRVSIRRGLIYFQSKSIKANLTAAAVQQFLATRWLFNFAEVSPRA